MTAALACENCVATATGFYSNDWCAAYLCADCGMEACTYGWVHITDVPITAGASPAPALDGA